jgi:hypothetical protein
VDLSGRGECRGGGRELEARKPRGCKRRCVREWQVLLRDGRVGMGRSSWLQTATLHARKWKRGALQVGPRDRIIPWSARWVTQWPTSWMSRSATHCLWQVIYLHYNISYAIWFMRNSSLKMIRIICLPYFAYHMWDLQNNQYLFRVQYLNKLMKIVVKIEMTYLNNYIDYFA